MSNLRIGNIVYYEDIKDCGYPIHIDRDIESWSFDKVIRIQPDGHLVMIKPMFFRCPEFWADNKHLKCVDSDVPKEIQNIHEFMNWYEDNYGEQPIIKRGGRPL